MSKHNHPWSKPFRRVDRQSWRVRFYGTDRPFSIKVWAWDAEDAAEAARLQIPDSAIIEVIPIKE